MADLLETGASLLRIVFWGASLIVLFLLATYALLNVYHWIEQTARNLQHWIYGLFHPH